MQPIIVIYILISSIKFVHGTFICPSDGMFENLDNSHTFWHCSNGIAYLKYCAASLIWSQKAQQCAWSKESTIPPLTKIPTTATTETIATTATTETIATTATTETIATTTTTETTTTTTEATTPETTITTTETPATTTTTETTITTTEATTTKTTITTTETTTTEKTSKMTTTTTTTSTKLIPTTTTVPLHNCLGSHLITFDDITMKPIDVLPYDYINLQWKNFHVMDITAFPHNNGNGFAAARRSGYVAFNKNGSVITISAQSPYVFNLYSFLASSGFRNKLKLTIIGRRQSKVRYSATYSLYKQWQQLIELNYLDIDSVTFSTDGSSEFAMDDLCVSVSSAKSRT